MERNKLNGNLGETSTTIGDPLGGGTNNSVIRIPDHNLKF
jgi:hypothetical protein